MARLKSDGLEGKIELVDLDSMRLDRSYQRDLKRNRLSIYEEFDPAMAGVLHAGRRPDGYVYLIDGQQRRWAMLERGIRQWKCYVISSPGPEYEAAIYHSINGKNRAKLTGGELFKAALVAGDPVAVTVNKVVEGAGLRLHLDGGSQGWPEVGCVGTVYREVRRAGEAVSQRALNLIVATWPSQDLALRDVFISSAIRIVRSQGDKLDDERFVSALSKLPPVKILNDASVSVDNRHAAVYDTFVRIYNKGLRGYGKLKLVKHIDDDAPKAEEAERA